MSTTPATSSLPTSCPSWCVADHAEQVFPEDRWHDGPVIEAPGIRRTLRRNTEGNLVGQVSATDLIVTARQSMDGSETWVFIGDEQGLEISLETASRVSRGLIRLLDEISGVADGRS